jgi:hypothetical protein
MNFHKNDVLNFAEIDDYLTSNCPSHRAEIIANKLNKYCYYIKRCFYKRDTTKSIYSIDFVKVKWMVKEHLLTIISKFLTASKNTLTEEEIITLMKNTKYQTMSENININKMLPQLMVYLSHPDEISANEKIIQLQKENDILRTQLALLTKPATQYLLAANGEEYIINESDDDLTDEELAELMKD